MQIAQTIFDFNRAKLIRKYLNPHNQTQGALIYRLIKEAGEIRTEQLKSEGLKLGVCDSDKIGRNLRKEGLVENYYKHKHEGTKTWRLK